MKTSDTDTLLMEEDVLLDFNSKERFSLIVIMESLPTKLTLDRNGVTLTVTKDWDKITKIGVTARRY